MTTSHTPTVPLEELRGRAARLWRHASAREFSSLCVAARVEVLYFSGTPQDGIVWLPREGDPLFLVRRDLERARHESPLPRILPFSRPRDIPELLAAEGVQLDGPVGTSLDILPVNLWSSLQRALGVPIDDASSELRQTRMVKSPYERQQVRQAGTLADKVFAYAREILTPGMREIDVAAAIDAFLVTSGSVSYYRTRTFNLEFAGLCCIAGDSADWRSASNSPNAAGRGPDPAFGQGSSDRRIGMNEPVLLDLGVNHAGYYVDTSRVLFQGALDERFLHAHATSEAILLSAVADIEVGLPLADVYSRACDTAASAGLADEFMGGSKFLGHGVGLEIDEWPVVAKGFDEPLPDGAVISLEPKFALPGGIVGVETTYIFENGHMQPTVQLPTGPLSA